MFLINRLFVHPNVYCVLFLDHAVHSMNTKTPPFMEFVCWWLRSYNSSCRYLTDVGSPFTMECRGILNTHKLSFSPASRPFCTDSDLYPPTPPPTTIPTLARSIFSWPPLFLNPGIQHCLSHGPGNLFSRRHILLEISSLNTNLKSFPQIHSMRFKRDFEVRSGFKCKLSYFTF